MKFTLALSLIAAAGLAKAQNSPGSDTGNCYTGRYNFTSARAYNAANPTDVSPDPTIFDWVVTPGSKVAYNSDGSVTFTLQPGSASGMSMTRFIKFGKVTGRIVTATSVGAVTGFITISEKHGTASDGSGATSQINDEIDWEVLGKDTSHPETNFFDYQSSKMERGMHGGPISGSITANTQHDFTIDWRSDGISWIVDGNQMRYQSQNTSFAKDGGLPAGTPWFPTQPSRVALSLWDGGASVASWAGGPTDFSKPVTATFSYVDVQCYDSSNNPVQKWPASAPNPAVNTSPTNGNTGVTYSKNTAVSTRGVSVLCGIASIFALFYIAA